MCALSESSPKASHAACSRRTCRCFRASANFRSLLGVDLPLTPGEHVLRGDVVNRAVQSNVVVMLDVTLHQTPSIFQRQRHSLQDALSLERFVPTFDFSVRLGKKAKFSRESSQESE